MAEFNYEDYTKMVEKAPKQSRANADAPRIRYFSLADDGDTAIVRFNIKDIDEIKVLSKHTVMSEGKRRNISCLRTPVEPIENCPLCAAGEKVSYRILIPMINYETTDNGVEAKPVVWEQSPRLRETLKSFVMDYGDLREYVFKIIRHGKRGDTSTTYTIIPANVKMYSPDVYKEDFSAFENYDTNYFITNKSKEDMEEFLETGVFPNPYKRDEETVNKENVKMTDSTPTVRTQSYDNNSHDAVNPTRTYNVEQPAQQSSGPRRYTY